MPSIRVGKWRLWIIPGDHEPRHVHVSLGVGSEGQAVFLLGNNGGIALREIRGHMSRSELRKAQEAVTSCFDELVTLWEEYR